MAAKKTVKLTINGRQVTAPAGVTVLRAAELSHIYIPTLCSHKDLTPYGGCRLCIVEIEGQRGYPLSCYTQVREDMVVKTETEAIRSIRQEVIQLILSEHPSSCLICHEAEECKTFSTTVRKAGVSSGCRYCPNDNQCELQRVVEYLEVKEVDYPIVYRGYEAERQDPFFDRDYNLCILCGRCVRMCQEMRGTGVLAFNWRGSKATVGPAFDRSHVEAGCEFCGACVSVCPTGTLVEKASKWEGRPEEKVDSTCPFCPIGCRLELWHKQGRFVKALPAHDPEVNDGQACLKGRFCLGEVSHHYTRSRKPRMLTAGDYWKEITWDEATAAAADALAKAGSADFAMLVSPDCNNETLYTAQKFARLAMGSDNIDCTARRTLGGGPGLWSRLFSRPIGLTDIAGARRILAVGLDTRFNFSVVGVEIRKALREGAELVTIDSRESNLARYAHTWLRPAPGREGRLLKALVGGKRPEWQAAGRACGVKADLIAEAADRLTGPLTVVVGPGLFTDGCAVETAAALQALLKRKQVNLVPLYHGANTRGALEMGAFADLLPGGSRADADARRAAEKVWGAKLPGGKGLKLADMEGRKKRFKVIYLVGAVPFTERPKCDFLIVQDLFEPPFPVDLFLPASSYLECDGTLINVEGRVQRSPRLEELPDSVMHGATRPDWWILGRVATKMGVKGFAWRKAAALQREIALLVPDFPAGTREKRGRRTMIPARGLAVETRTGAVPGGRMMLVRSDAGYTHRGINLVDKVEGLQILDPERGFHLNPGDAAGLGVKEGERIRVKAGRATGAATVRFEPELPPGCIAMTRPGGPAPPGEDGLEALFDLPRNPCPVEVSKDGV